MSKNCPRSLIDKSWPNAPEICREASELLKVLHRKCLVRAYCSKISPARKQLLEEKVLAESLFKFKKANYSSLVGRSFIQFRLSKFDKTEMIFFAIKILKNIQIFFHSTFVDEDDLKYFEKNIKQIEEKIVYASSVIKIDRHGYKSRKRVLVITSTNIYILDEKATKVKDKIQIESIIKLYVSSLSDGFLIIAFSNDLKLEKVRMLEIYFCFKLRILYMYVNCRL